MIDTSNLPYWARKYVEHINEHLPDTYDELEESGELREVALSVQKSASTAFDRLYDSYIQSGSNETSAAAFANSEVMRTYICIPPDDDEDDELDAIIEDFDAISEREAYEDATVID
ncbi:MAG: hypothetical protein AAF329_20075 [Cyanobacteria bacterium P01_A01_bin.17]